MPKKKTTTKPVTPETVDTDKPFTMQVVVNDRTIHERMAAVCAEVAYIYRDASPHDKAGHPLWTAASYDAIVRKVRPAMLKHGILVYPCHSSFHVTRDGNSLLVEVALRFVNTDHPQDFITVPGCCMGTRNSGGAEQLAGSLQTYAYKSALKYALLLETGDDPDLAPPVDIKLTPEIEAKVARVRELVGLIAPEDPESFIRDKLAALSAKYARPVGFLEGLPEKLLDGWISQLDKTKPKKTDDVAPPPGGNEDDAPESSGNTFDPEPEPKVDPKGTPVDLTGGEPDTGPPDAPAEDVSKVPPRDRASKLIAWMSSERGKIPQGTIRNAFGGWMFQEKYERKLTDDKKWVEIWDRRAEILADLDKRVEAKS